MQKHLTDSNVAETLQRLGLLEPGEAAEVEPAGDGNINWVRRIRAPGYSASAAASRSARFFSTMRAQKIETT